MAATKTSIQLAHLGSNKHRKDLLEVTFACRILGLKERIHLDMLL